MQENRRASNLVSYLTREYSCGCTVFFFSWLPKNCLDGYFWWSLRAQDWNRKCIKNKYYGSCRFSHISSIRDFSTNICQLTLRDTRRYNVRKQQLSLQQTKSCCFHLVADNMRFLLASMTLFAALVITLEAEQSPVKELTDETFKNYLNVSQVAIVDFFAPW